MTDAADGGRGAQRAGVDADDDAPPVAQIGPYRLEEQLGAGGMGVVYRATHAESGAAVALKTVRAVDPATVRSIRREIHALRKLRHPGVARIVDEGLSDDGLPWYAMELVEGRSLRRTLAIWWRGGDPALAVETTRPEGQAPSGMRTVGARLRREAPGSVDGTGDTAHDGDDDDDDDDDHTDGGGDEPARAAPPAQRTQAAHPAPTAAAGRLREALAIVHALCDALAFIHGEGLVHRDLKPENVIVRGDDGTTPVLVDFGLAGAFSGAGGRESLEVVGGIEGSYGYIAPEQIRAEVADARADLYALGCILYELTTSHLPFEAEGYGVLGQHLLEEPAPPSTRVAGVPPALDALVLRLLAKRPADRFGYATDVARAIADIVEVPARDAGGAAPAPAPRTYLYRPEFVGRAEVLGRFETWLDEAAEGTPRTVLLAGESGAGKTRLAAEMGAVASRRQFQVFTGECVAIEGGSPHAHGGDAPAGAPGTGAATTAVHAAALHPLRRLLETVADRCRALGERESARLLGARARVLALYEPSLAALPYTAQSPEPPELPPQAARHRLFQYIAETFAALAQDGPVLLVLDDLQWADELTLALLAWLQGGLAPGSARLLVVGTYRSEEAGTQLRELARDPRVHAVPLERLDQATVAQMAVNMLALASPPDEFVRFLTAESAGNPFFIAEYLRAAVEAGLLRRGEQGAWELTDAGGDASSGSFHRRLGLPRTVRDLVARRLAGLSPDAADLAAAAAVLGREFETELLARLAGLPDARELEAGQELLRAHILELGAGGTALRFAHDKLREIAYDGIEPARRRALHRRAAERLEARHAAAQGAAQPALAPLYPALVHHWSAAGDEDRTLEYLEKAGRHAFRTAAHAEAAVLLRRALDLAAERARAGRAPAPAPAWQAGLEALLAEALFAVGDLAGCRDCGLAALARLGHPLPTTRPRWTQMLLTEALAQGWHLLAPERAASPRAGPAGAGDHDGAPRQRLVDAARVASRLSECFYWEQQVVPMVVANLVGVNLAERAGRAREVRRLYASLGYLAGLARMHGLARRYFDRACGGDDVEEGVGYGYVLESMYHLVFADLGRTERAAERAVEIYTALGDPQQIEIAQTMRAQPDYYAGRFALTLPRFAEIRRAARARENAQHDAWGAYATARSLIPLGRLEEAVALSREAIALLASGVADRPSEIISHGLLAAAHLARGEHAAARAAADRAMALAQGVQPTVYSEGHGYEGAAVVYLDAWERAGGGRWFGGGDAARGARAACARLTGFARTYPLARAAALRCEGTRAWLEGRARRAEALWAQSAAAAEAAGMPYDAALARLERGRTAPRGSEVRRRELAAAREAFRALGCAALLARVEALPV